MAEEPVRADATVFIVDTETCSTIEARSTLATDSIWKIQKFKTLKTLQYNVFNIYSWSHIGIYPANDNNREKKPNKTTDLRLKWLKFWTMKAWVNIWNSFLGWKVAIVKIQFKIFRMRIRCDWPIIFRWSAVIGQLFCPVLLKNNFQILAQSDNILKSLCHGSIISKKTKV